MTAIFIHIVVVAIPIFFTPTMKFFCFIFTDFLPSLPLSTCDDVTIFFAAQARRVFSAQSGSAFSFANHKENKRIVALARNLFKTHC